MAMKRAPGHLSAEAKRLWRKFQTEYAIQDEGGVLILQTALEAFDRMREAQDIIAAEGQVLVDRFGQKKSHPSCTVERDSRSAMVHALKMLNLDLEPLRDGPGRPGGS